MSGSRARMAGLRSVHGVRRSEAKVENVKAEYRIWNGIKQRCLNPNNAAYGRYGGRGISVCPEWQKDFKAFYAHVGSRPDRYHSIDRIDNDGNYEPGNVRWATAGQQAANRRPYTFTGTPSEYKQYAVRFTQEEMRAILKQAKKEKMGMAAWIRLACSSRITLLRAIKSAETDDQ